MKLAHVAILTCCVPGILRSQPATSANTTGLRPDSVPWRPILEYVVKSLAVEIVRASTDSALKAWQIVLPDSSPAWQRFRSHLSLSLRARDTRPGDLTLDEVTIGPMRIRGDTAWVRLTRTHTRQCPDRVGATGFGNHEEVFVVRFQDRFWSVARSASGTHGDHAGC